MKTPFLLCILLTLWFTSASARQAGEKKPRKPTATDKCPVCGMFVHKYPDFLAQVIFKDGSVAFFDGTKDMFKYLFNMKKYNQKQTRENVDSIYAQDYYSLSPIDCTTAYYVIGSDVYGPMGSELIPFGKEAEAKEFMKDHKGKQILRFKDITLAVVKGIK